MNDHRVIEPAVMDKIQSALNALSDADYAKLSNPDVEIQIKVSRPKKARAQAKPKPEISFELLTERLATFDERTAAQDYVRSVARTKKDLEAIARHFDMVIVKRDTLQTLVERIVETTVGARLRSRAIQGPGSMSERTQARERKDEKAGVTRRSSKAG